MIKVSIADDHRIVREGLRRILAEAPDIKVMDEAGDSREIIEKIRSNRPDVVLMDISMPDMDGLDATKQIHALFPELPILILTVHPARQYASRILRAGARGYLNKQAAPEELIDAVRKVCAGRRYLSPEVSEELALQLIGEGADFSPVESLSDRELQILCLIAKGRKATEIAEGLCLSIKTVNTYRARVLYKLHLRNNADLTRFAIKNNLIK
ncbi:MAG TPA: response regulator [Proteobacteria bacterium]|nr:response regulator [Pseudomonadota bacterium]